ncbi:hypothetical protein AB6A40_008160 [Gnathostoma spinigerum]|uniref:Uncharacterized protein n=1 Tax=Gnathostoma spinigerum TaxID=75299 RepID=A0ABD6EQ87_9BILA
MSNNDKSVDTQLGWIYQGTKALVNREDYLLGKRLDKNFEMYSDAVVKEKPDQFDALVEAKGRFSPAASSSKVSALEVNIIKNEDPLVAIKVKEESLWREKMENPLLVLKMQKMLKKAMEKEERKKLKKAEKQRMREERRKERKENNGSTHTHSKHDVEREKRHSNSKHRDHSHRERHRVCTLIHCRTVLEFVNVGVRFSK